MARATWGLLVLLASSHASADVDPCACSPNKPGFHRADTLSGDWGGVRANWLAQGLKISGTYAGEIFAAPGFDDDRVVAAGLAVLAIDLELDTGLPTFHAAALGIHGDGLSERLMDVYGVSNNVATRGVRLFEAWGEEAVGPVTLRAGLLSADQEFILAEHSTVLLNATFGIVAMLSYNVGNPVYPVATPGASLRYESEGLTVRAAIYDGDQQEDHGVPTGLGDEALFLGEVELGGTLELGAWHHTERGNGYYAILDQQVSTYVGAFARLAIAPDQPIETYADMGVRVRNGPWRAHDFTSIGIAFANGERGPQTIAELTYQILARGWLTIQPDVQVVLERTGTSGIIATRAVVAF